MIMESKQNLLRFETSSPFKRQIQTPNLLIVVPVYNEANILLAKLTLLYNYLTTIDSFLLVLSVDDSGDESVRIVNEFMKSHNNVEVIIHNEKKGRGFAVREAWIKFEANYYSFIDADLATGVEVIQESLKVLEPGKVDIVTASRYCPGAKVDRPPLRNTISKIYNYMLRILFNDKLNDHQCGFKIINNRVKESILKKTEINSWFWDTELLVKAAKYHFEIIEVPVTWTEKKYKRTSFRRLVKDIGIHGYGIFRLVQDVKDINGDIHRDSKEEINAFPKKV